MSYRRKHSATWPDMSATTSAAIPSLFDHSGRWHPLATSFTVRRLPGALLPMPLFVGRVRAYVSRKRLTARAIECSMSAAAMVICNGLGNLQTVMANRRNVPMTFRNVASGEATGRGNCASHARLHVTAAVPAIAGGYDANCVTPTARSPFPSAAGDP